MQEVLPRIIVAETNKDAPLNIRISLKYLAALFPLMIILGELHEQVHITVGRIICGGYGPRDFNAWQTAADCANPSWTFLATMVGPLFSYAVMWLGAFLLLKARSLDYKAIGFTLIFAPLPFARIFTAAMGGGDEKVVLRRFLDGDFSPGTIKIFAFIVVSLFCVPPLLIALRSIKNRFSLLYVIGFCVLPLIILGAYVLTFLNSMLSSSSLSEVSILGTPDLIIAHFLLMTTLLFFSRRWLFKLRREPVVGLKPENKSLFSASFAAK